MKIDINKDFEKAFPDDLWKGFTLKQIITFAIGIIMAAGTIAALWKFMKISPITGSYIAIPVMLPICFFGIYESEPFVMGNVERDAVLQGNQKTYLWGGRSSEDRQDIYHASSCCKKEKEKKEGESC